MISPPTNIVQLPHGTIFPRELEEAGAFSLDYTVGITWDDSHMKHSIETGRPLFLSF